jgi:prepilin-type N-terminal cleavage/methylation domain-containing protein/prepilin-type processing-associated H-X9-DG protein
MNRRAFTLVEMLVAVAILATLTGIGIPVARSMIASSREAACLGNLRSLGVGMESYLQENQRRLPRLVISRTSKSDPSPALETVLLPYLESAGVFRCPADSEDFEKTGSSYAWNGFLDNKLMSDLSLLGIEDREDRIPLIFDKQSRHPNGTNFLYADLSSSNKDRFAAGN